MSKKYRIAEFAERIGKSTSTIRRWESEGRFVSKRSIAGQRYFEESDVLLVLGVDAKRTEQTTVVYCRVSSQGQRDDLKSQVAAMQQFCLASGLAVDEWIEEIGGGMNFKRKRFCELMNQIERREVSTLVIAHKDRLVRFGFEYFHKFATDHGCKMVVANQEQLSPTEEAVADLMTIVHTFSCRLYGLRNYSKQIRKAATQ